MFRIKNFKLFGILTLILAFLIFTHFGYSLMNPAEVYCKALGYESKTVQTEEGEVGICVFPDNTSANEWDFLLGRQALQNSYCAKQGYEAKHLESSAICKECTACVLPNGTEIEVTKLMGLSFEEGRCGDGICTTGENYSNCPKDCSSGSEDGYCDGVTDDICDPDCIALEMIEKDPDCATTSTIPTCNSNGICEQGETYGNCPKDCPKPDLCGNGVCDNNETSDNCCKDCTCPEGKKCLQNKCIPNLCGNGFCEPKFGEDYKTCKEDCPSGSKDNYCDGLADGICDPDCSKEEDIDCEKPNDSSFIYVIIVVIFVALIIFVIVRSRRAD